MRQGGSWRPFGDGRVSRERHGRADASILRKVPSTYRLAVIAPRYHDGIVGGSEQYLRCVLGGLCRRGVRVTVLTTCDTSVGFDGWQGLTWPNALRPDDEEGPPAVRRHPCLSIPRRLRQLAARDVTRSLGRAAALCPLPTDGDGLPTRFLAERLDASLSAWSGRAAAADAILKGPFSPSLLGAAIDEARESDVVLATNVPFLSLSYGLIAARLTGRPFLAMPFFHLRDQYHHRPVYRAVLRRADRVLCLGRAMKSFVEEVWGGHGAYVGGGIDPAELTAEKISGKKFRDENLLGSAPIVLFVGRKTPSKGYGMLLEAFERVVERIPSCRLVMIGPDEDRRPVAGRGVLYLGEQPRSKVLDAFDACDVFVLPSLFESFGLVFLEAWMRGKPVVGHAGAEAARAMIDEGRDGELASTPEGLAGSICSLLSDPERRRAMGEAGRMKTLTQYTWDIVVERLRAVIEQVAGRTGESG